MFEDPNEIIGLDEHEDFMGGYECMELHSAREEEANYAEQEARAHLLEELADLGLSEMEYESAIAFSQAFNGLFAPRPARWAIDGEVLF